MNMMIFLWGVDEGSGCSKHLWDGGERSTSACRPCRWNILRQAAVALLLTVFFFLSPPRCFSSKVKLSERSDHKQMSYRSQGTMVWIGNAWRAGYATASASCFRLTGICELTGNQTSFQRKTSEEKLGFKTPGGTWVIQSTGYQSALKWPFN